MSSELGQLRSTIDLIDDQILELVERRLDVARRIADVKKSSSPALLKLCPAREDAIIARLEEKASHSNRKVVRHVWRELMAHCLQAQGRLDLVIAGTDARLVSPLRQVFGSAPQITQAPTHLAAVERAESGEAVAILPWPLPPLSSKLVLLKTILDEGGVPIAGAVGRASEGRHQESWSPSGWRDRKASQMPIYGDASALGRVEEELSAAPEIVGIQDIVQLKQALGRAAEGDGVLIQGGDCAEPFGVDPNQVHKNHELLHVMAAHLPVPAILLARAAGQFAKPRSASVEMSDEGAIPTYRGDAVNAAMPCRRGRTPDPQRLLRAHAQSLATAKLLKSLSSPARLKSHSGRVYVSHEGLLLNYEQALTRWDDETGRWWATSGHSLWIGDRTRDLDGAHVEFARGVGNPIGLKCGPDLQPDELLRLADRLDPANEAGRLTLIARLGPDHVDKRLPALLRATHREGRKVLWICDPMHGNTRTVDGIKTRLMDDVRAELSDFVAIAAAEGIHPGGMHLEMTAQPVTECADALTPATPAWLRLGYESLCDPRLNGVQAVDVAAHFASLLATHICGKARAA